MNKNRDFSIDFLKGILIILVVFGHSIQYLYYTRSAEFWTDPVFKAIYMFHMPAFIAVSGYLAGRKIDGTVSLNSLVRGRILPVMGPLATWSLLFGLVMAAKAHVHDPIVAGEIALSAIFSTYWFLWALIVGAPPPGSRAASATRGVSPRSFSRPVS